MKIAITCGLFSKSFTLHVLDGGTCCFTGKRFCAGGQSIREPGGTVSPASIFSVYIVPPSGSDLNCTTFDKLILRKIIKILAKILNILYQIRFRLGLCSIAPYAVTPRSLGWI